MSREVRRVPMDWQHPMEWCERWDRDRGCVRQMLVPKPLFRDFADAYLDWEKACRELEARTGWDWDFSVEYHLTGFQGSADPEPVIHPYYLSDDESGTPIVVRDEDHLFEMLLATQRAAEPDPAEYMPDFSEHDPDSLGWCMYETTSEGTPISPVMESPEALARWLADSGASTFGDSTASYERWLSMIQAGSSIGSAVFIPGKGLISGVEAVSMWADS